METEMKTNANENITLEDYVSETTSSPRSNQSDETMRKKPKVPVFKYIKATVTGGGVFYFTNIRELYEHQFQIGLSEELFKYYRTLSQVYLARLKNGKCYVPKTKPAINEFLQVEVVELQPIEFRQLQSKNQYIS